MAFVQKEWVRWLLTVAVVVLLVLFVLQLRQRPDKPSNATLLIKGDGPNPNAVVAASEPAVVPGVAVDVIGAVQQPGVYYLDPKARVADAVTAAGGFAPDVARDKINLAAMLVDGTQIRVPRVGEQPETGEAIAAPASDLVNINTADVSDLEALPGIGPATARSIIEQRTSNGAFKQVEDLQNVKGIGPSLFARLRPRITVGP